MLLLTASEVQRALPMDQTIAAMKRAYEALSAGQAQVPLRSRLPVPPHEGVSLFMPAYVEEESGEALAIKVVSVFAKNAEKNLPIIHAAVLVMEAETGRVLALLEGGALTAIRTGAGSGAATDLLARENSKVAAIFGAGVQARTQLEAICTVRSIEQAWIYDPSSSRVEAMIGELSGQGPIPKDLRAAASPSEATKDADIICTATTSQTPVFQDKELKAGVHLNGIGSYTPEMQEVPGETVGRAKVVVDSRQASLVESGDLIKPIKEGTITEADIHAELGEIVSGDKPGRKNDEEVTFFKSVGVAVQDAMAGQLALVNAKKLKLGQEVDW